MSNHKNWRVYLLEREGEREYVSDNIIVSFQEKVTEAMALSSAMLHFDTPLVLSGTDNPDSDPELSVMPISREADMEVLKRYFYIFVMKKKSDDK